MTETIIDNFIEKWLGFDLQLREKCGLNEITLEELIELLKEINISLEGKDSIPKRLVEIFLDMWGGMTSCAEMYDADEQKKIYMAADHLTYYARVICTS